MATKALKIENSGKIASFVARYSNKSTGSGYKSAIESFLRCMNNLPKTTPEGKKATYDYESLFDAYITEKRDHSDDMEKFAHCLKVDCTSLLSARQIMTYARCIII